MTAKDKKGECKATGPSRAVPGHNHTCVGQHDAGDHFCGLCLRWWYIHPGRSIK